jgi:hypothetical protein
MDKCCERCGKPMLPIMSRQRFCCRSCSDEWFQAERRQAVEWFRATGGTVSRDIDKETAA